MRNFFVALQSLTIIPLKPQGEISEDDRTKSMAWFPLVGLFLGAILILISLVSSFFFPPLIVTALVLIALVICTGALPLEGFAHTWGGFLRGKNREEVFTIMGEKHLSFPGIIGLISLFLVKFVLLYTLLERGEFSPLLLMPVIGRWAVVVLGTFIPYTRETDKNNPPTSDKDDDDRNLFRASVITLIISLLLFRFFAIPLMATVCLSVLAWRWFSLKKIGAITGAVRGATTELMEVVTLLLINLI